MTKPPPRTLPICAVCNTPITVTDHVIGMLLAIVIFAAMCRAHAGRWPWQRADAVKLTNLLAIIEAADAMRDRLTCEFMLGGVFAPRTFNFGTEDCSCKSCNAARAYDERRKAIDSPA